MAISEATRVREILSANPGAIRVLEDAGVDYCCGGERSLHEACLNAGVPAEKVLRRLEENRQQAGPEEVNWAAASLSNLTQHIREEHHKYVRQAMPRLQKLAAKVNKKHGDHHPELTGIEGHLDDLGAELLLHMEKEEQILFPYIEALDRAAGENRSPEPPLFESLRNPIQAMMHDHDSTGEVLRAMRKLSAGYQVPADGCDSYRELYRRLQEFEADLHTHIHLENNVLFPRAIELEASAS